MSSEKFHFTLDPVDVPKVETTHRRIATRLPVPESLEILERIRKYESPDVMNQLPVVWERAQGHRIFDKWGNAWIDMTSTIFVANVGHAHPYLVKAITDQAAKLLHAYSYPTEIRSLYLEKLIKATPPRLTKAALYSAGTEATERALRLARLYGLKSDPVRRVVVTWEGAYHGKTMGAQFLCGQPKDKQWIGFHDPNIVHLPFPYPWLVERSGVDGRTLFTQHLAQLADKGVKHKDIVAFLAEPYQGWGATFYPKDYIQAVRDWANDHDALLMFDEIQAGFGRCGTFFAHEHYGVEADLVCCGKGISGSMPLSAVIARGDLIDLDPAYTSTHGGHPMACAAGLAVLEIMERENLVAESARKEAIFLAGIGKWRARHPDRIGPVYGKGCLFGIFITKDGTPETLDPVLTDRIVERAMQKGVFLIRTGRGTLKLGPPLSIPDDALEEALDVIGECLDELAGDAA